MCAARWRGSAPAGADGTVPARQTEGVTLPSVHLTSLVSEQNPTYGRLTSLARAHPPTGYTLTESRRDADVVLFVESGYFGLGSIGKFHAISKENRSARYFVFSEGDWPFAYVPGLYCSLTKSLPWAFSWAYLLDQEEPSEGDYGHQPYLFSFLGRVSTHPVRERIRRLDGPASPCLDVSFGPKRFDCWDYKRTFSRVMRESCFVLCPRGIGASSTRIFEAMRSRRVPVIISDAWIQPPVGDWPGFSIRVPEHATERIPQICEQHRDAARSMGTAARQAFDAYFSPSRFLDNALDFMRSATQTASLLRPARLVRQAARAISRREIRTVAHYLRNAVRAVGST